MENIGLYRQLTDFTSENAGTSEWCVAKRDGATYFVKKLQSPVYPAKDIGLPEKKYNARVARFHKTLGKINALYEALRKSDSSGIPLIPMEVMNYRFHICTVAEYAKGNVKPDQVCRLSPWQRLALMRSLTLGLMDVHKAGVIHSDMKPDNAIITQSEDGRCRLRLIDFDSSYFESDPPQDIEDINGDPAYFAPEVYARSAGQPGTIDCRADIFALGVVLHYYWCGKLPGRSEGRTVGETVLAGESVTLDDSLPLALQKLIMRMLEKDPAARASLQSVYNVLGAQLEQCPMEIVRLTKDAPSEKKPRETGSVGSDAEPTPTLRVRCLDEYGEVLKEKVITCEYGGYTMVMADTVEGYRLSDPYTRNVMVDWHGERKTPLDFRYEPAEKEKPGMNPWMIAAIATAVLFVVILLLYNLE